MCDYGEMSVHMTAKYENVKKQLHFKFKFTFEFIRIQMCLYFPTYINVGIFIKVSNPKLTLTEVNQNRVSIVVINRIMRSVYYSDGSNNVRSLIIQSQK